MWPRPSPLPACGERSEFARSLRKFRVRGRLRESEPVERPPLPDPLHSPSIGSRVRRAQWQAPMGVNALMASGEREQRSLLGRWFEIPQIGRRLIFLGRHQEPLPAQKIVFLADSNLPVALGDIIFGPVRM